MIRELLQMFIILLFGQQNQVRPVHDLRKREQRSLFSGLKGWVQRNYYLIALVSIPILFALFIIICFAICGVSATESGTVYNSFGKVI